MDDIVRGRLEMRRAKSTAKLTKKMTKITSTATRKFHRTSISTIKKLKRLNAKMTAMKPRAHKVKPRRVSSAARHLLRLASGLEGVAYDLLATAQVLTKKKKLTPQTISFLDLPVEIRLKIYNEYLHSGSMHEEYFTFVSLESLQLSTLAPIQPMLRTCTQIYHEFLPVMLATELAANCSLDVDGINSPYRLNLLDPRIFTWMANSPSACIMNMRINYDSSSSRSLMWNIHVCETGGRVTIKAWYEWVHAIPELCLLKATLTLSNAELQVAKHLRKVLPEMVKDNGLRGLGLAELEVIRAVMALYLPKVPKSL